MNRGQMKTHIGLIVNRSDTHDDLVEDALNFALQEISMRHAFRDMKSQSNIVTADGVAYATLPTSTHRVVEARLIDGTQSYELDLRPKRQLVNLHPNASSESEGKPDFAYQEGSLLYLFPIPDDAYTITLTVVKLMADMDDDSDTPEVSGIDRVIIAWAVSWVYEALDMHDTATRWLQRFEMLITQAILDDETRIAENLVMQPHTSGMTVYPNDYYNDPFFKMPGG